MRLFMVAGLLAASALPAQASGGLACTAEDGNAEISVEAGVTRGLGSPVFSLSGRSVLMDTTIAIDLRNMSFDKSHLAQYWLDGEDLRLLLYRERTAAAQFGEVELTIRATADPEDESAYRGSYSVKVYDAGESGSEGKTTTVEGEIACSVE